MLIIWRRLLAIGCSYVAVGGVAFAAPDPKAQPEPEPIGQVVVTAQFHQQKLQSVPLSITAVSAAVLEQRAQTDVAGIANDAPNVTLAPLGASFGVALGASIRGIGQFDFNPALEPGVGLYVDDVYYPTLTGSDLDLLDLDRVEILRGPQGTLTGRNSIGGAIRLVSKQPGDADGGYLEATYGSRNHVELRGAANIAINDQLSVRLAAVGNSQDGYVSRIDYGCAFPGSGVPTLSLARKCTVSEDGGVNYQGLRAAIRYRPNNRIQLTITGDYSHSDATPPAEVLTYANLTNPNTNPAPGVPYDSRFICGKYCNYAADAQPATRWVAVGAGFGGYPLAATEGSDHDRFDGAGVAADLAIDLTDTLSLESITAHREYKTTFNSDDDLSPANIGYGLNRLTHVFTSEEFRLTGTLSQQLKFTVGAFFSSQKSTYYTLQDIRYAAIPLQFVGNDPIPANTEAGFATVFWSPTSALNVTAGVRYTREAKDYTFTRDNFDGTPNPFLGSLNGTTGHYRGDHFDYRVSVDYRWNQGLMTYATISTGFKGGGINPRPFNVAQVQPFAAETLTAYEVGAKTDAFDGRLRLNVSAFYNQYNQIQIALLSCPQFGGPGPCALPENAGNADIKGAEVEANAILMRGWTLDASASYLDFTFTKLDPLTGLVKSDQQAMTPKFKLYIGTQYVFDLGNAGSLTPRIDISYQDSEYAYALNSPLNFIPSFAVANARITWLNTNRDLQAALEILNLTGEYYYTSKFDLTGAGAGLVKASPGRPREFAVSIKKTF